MDDETSITYYGKRTHPEICWVRPRLGSSNFGVCITELVDGLVHVLHAEEYQRPDFNQMTEDLFYSFKNGISNAFNDCAKSNLQTFFDIYYLFGILISYTFYQLFSGCPCQCSFGCKRISFIEINRIKVNDKFSST